MPNKGGFSMSGLGVDKVSDLGKFTDVKGLLRGGLGGMSLGGLGGGAMVAGGVAAAGVAAALACREKTDARTLDVSLLRETLKSQGAVLEI